ncbi:GNAT family protein [Rossellomorea marisflavi]|uniref:GNAT family N-acetyltransferase n=1 Tax=Rossellomorea marisflavi TaxID=189381 RepID=UPI00345AB51A
MKQAFPTIETKRLTLVNTTADDARFILALYKDPLVCRYLYDEEPFTSIDQAEEWIDWHEYPEDYGRNRWIIRKKETATPIGTCGFDQWDVVNHVAEIGFDLWHGEWGKGYMSEALTASIDSGFRNMGLNRIQAFVALENTASCRLLERLGFEREGIFREKHFFQGNYYDHYIYSLLKKDWKKGGL